MAVKDETDLVKEHQAKLKENDIAVQLPVDNEEQGKKDAKAWLAKNPQFKSGEEEE